jgi:hypothetical protein
MQKYREFQEKTIDTIGCCLHGDVEEEEVQSRALGPCSVLQALHAVKRLQRGETPSEEYTETVWHQC